MHEYTGIYYLMCCYVGSIGAHGSYTESAWPIYINDLNCTGSEESVWECPHNGIEGYSCNHRQDASVMCQGTCTNNQHTHAFSSACLVGRYLHPSCYILFTMLFMLNFIGHPRKDLWTNPANIEGRNVSAQK